ncbi:FAD:protein FMN transferase [Tardiphaga sp.]|jgi:thiamine biosynthesis lipoprotein|uniref:FAD:protein FMN transferase n=1 Tax=Tardiphaga sp. TaxID=1926292 RepID=UPI0037D9E0F9
MDSESFRRVAIPHDVKPRAMPAGASLQILAGQTMGTSWSVRFYGTAAARETLNRAVQRCLDLVVNQMSLWEPESDISRLNRQPPGSWLNIAAEFDAVTTAALRIARLTGGTFDPTVGRLVNRWGFGPAADGAQPPSQHETRMQIGWRQLEHDAVGRRVRRLAPVSLDFNGIAKGFAVDLVMTTLRQHGLHNALVEIGGELSGAGTKPDGSPWWVDVEARDLDGGLPGAPLRIALHESAIATSGCERHVLRDGQALSHTIDPATGRPIANRTIAATVLHRSCMEADAFATAFMVMEPNAAIDCADRLELPVIIRLRNPERNETSERISSVMREMLA